MGGLEPPIQLGRRKEICTRSRGVRGENFLTDYTDFTDKGTQIYYDDYNQSAFIINDLNESAFYPKFLKLPQVNHSSIVAQPMKGLRRKDDAMKNRSRY